MGGLQSSGSRLCERPELLIYILSPDKDRNRKYLQVYLKKGGLHLEIHRFYIEFELFKYVSVGQSATGHRKTSKGKRNN